jgi:hypothetical protein
MAVVAGLLAGCGGSKNKAVAVSPVPQASTTPSSTATAVPRRYYRFFRRCRPLLAARHRSGTCTRDGQTLIVGAQGEPVEVGPVRMAIRHARWAKRLRSDDEPDIPLYVRAHGRYLLLTVRVANLSRERRFEWSAIQVYGNRLLVGSTKVPSDSDAFTYASYHSRDRLLLDPYVGPGGSGFAILAYDVQPELQASVDAGRALVQFVVVTSRQFDSPFRAAAQIGVVRVPAGPSG